MKLRGDFNEWTVTQSLLAKILGLSVPRVNAMIEEEIVVRDESDKSGGVKLIDSLRNYYLSKNASGDNVNFWKEKALRERVNRQRDELKLKKEDGSVYDAKTVELAFIELVTILKTQLLSLPAKFAVQLEGKTRSQMYDILTAELEEKLLEMSQYDFKEIKEESKGDAEE